MLKNSLNFGGHSINVVVLIFLFHFSLLSSNLNDKDSNCKYFIGKNEKNQNSTKKFNLFDGIVVFNYKDGKYFDEYTGKTNIKFKDGVSICEYGNYYVATFEVKNNKIIKFELTHDDKLYFLGTYNNYGLNGKIKKLHVGETVPTQITYKNGIPNGEMIEYYNNGKIYRKFNLRGKNKKDYRDYYKIIEGSYQIYDINTGEKIYEGKILNGTGKMIEYDRITGKIKKEYDLKNRKIDGIELIYNETGKVKEENHYENGKITEQRVYYEDGDIRVNGFLLRKGTPGNP